MKMRIQYFLRLTILFLFIAGTVSSQSLQNVPAEKLKKMLKGTRADTGRVRILLVLSRNFLFRSGATRADLDSSFMLMKECDVLSRNLNNQSSIGNTLLMAALIFNRRDEKEKGLKASQNALAIFTGLNDLIGEAESNIMIGQHFSSEGAQLDSKINYYVKAVGLFKKAGAMERAATTLKDIGDFQIEANRNEDAFQSLKESLAIYKLAGYKNLQGVYDLLGYNQVHMGDYINALKYGLLAVKTAEALKDTSAQLCTIYNRVALSYYFCKKYPDAAEYFQKSLSLAYKFKDTSGIVSISLNLAASAAKDNRLGLLIPLVKKLERFKAYRQSSDMQLEFSYIFLNIYLQTKKFDEAKPYLEKIKVFYTQPDLQNELHEKAIRALIFYYQATNQYQKAYPYLEEHTAFCKKNKLMMFTATEELWWFKSDSATGRLASAIRHYQKFKMADDSILNENNSKQIALIEVQYESEKKDKDIQLKANNIQLLTRQGQLQKIKFEQERVTRNVMIAGAIMLLLVLGIGYNRLRLKQRNNRLLHAQQAEINKQNQTLLQLNGKQNLLLKEKEWLLREIHHRVKNNLQITMSLLNIQSGYLENGQALDAIRDSQRRMFAMSLIHQKLYQSDSLALIDMSTYIPELISFLKESFEKEGRICFMSQTIKLELDISEAVPLGLILNEAITNCIKYAFPNSCNGKIFINLNQVDEEHYELCIADNGIGLPDKFDGNTHNSLGMNLIRGLTEQIDGEFSITNDHGTSIRILFKGSKFNNGDLTIMDNDFNN